MLKYIILLAAIMWSSVSYGQDYLLTFGASWCNPCHRLEANIENPQVKKLLSQKQIELHKIDIDRDEKYSRLWGIGTVPTLVLCKSEDGRTIEIKRSVGYIGVNDLLKFLK
jgi:thioredoxin-like negative regulator of GroEL